MRRRRCQCCVLLSVALAAVTLIFGRSSDGDADGSEERIDVVYTWVNGTDPLLLRAIESYGKSEEDSAASRFDDKHELKYSLRSLDRFAPWIGRVFVVTADQLPSWLDVNSAANAPEHPLTVISHSDIIPQDFLPTFSSPAIECFLHNIPDLSERFLYFNDDIFLGAPVHISDFYTPADGYRVYTAWGVPDCARGCPWSFLGDGSCDRSCNNVACDYDGGDCSEDHPLRPPELSDDYADEHFFEDDNEDDDDIDPMDDRDGYPRQPADSDKFQARQIRDGQLLQKLVDLHKEENGTPQRKYQRSLRKKGKRRILTHETDYKVNRRKRSIDSPPRNSSDKTKSVSVAKRSSEKKFSQKMYKDSNKKSADSVARTNFKNVLSKSPDTMKNNITNVIDQYNRNVIQKDKENRKKRNIPSGKDNKANKSDMYNDSRKLDIYAKSLIHTNKVFNKVYGFQNRKVPAHVPFLLEKKVIVGMHQKFSSHIGLTQSNKFRRPNDFQFGFSYYHYLMSERGEYTIEEIFDRFDTDKSGTWSDREVRTVLAKLNRLPLTAAMVHSFESDAKSCDSEEHRSHPTPPNERYMDSDMPTLTKKLIVDCPVLRDPIQKVLGRKNPTAFSRPAAPLTTFVMLSSNITKAVMALDEIRRDTKKFICINDNLDSKQEEENEIVRMVLQELYDALLPLPSRGELPSHVANRFSRLSDLKSWQQSRRVASRLLILCAIMLIILTVHQTDCHRLLIRQIKRIV